MELDEVVDAFGVQAIETNSLHPDLDGMYLIGRNLIVLRKGLDYWTKRSTLAHELAHHVHQDETYGDPRAERRGDLFAANLLILPIDCKNAELIHGEHIGTIAHELGVTPHLAAIWRDHHQHLKEEAR